MNSSNLIDGKAFAAGLRERVTEEVAKLKAGHGVVPGLAAVLVGEDRVPQQQDILEVKLAAEQQADPSEPVQLRFDLAALQVRAKLDVARAQKPVLHAVAALHDGRGPQRRLALLRSRRRSEGPTRRSQGARALPPSKPACSPRSREPFARHWPRHGA